MPVEGTMRLLSGTRQRLQEICDRLAIGLKTASEHVRRMNIAGLVLKLNDGRWVRHKLTKRGTDILTFLRTLE